ncbi:ATP-dependent endonuclease [Arthrobacter dokdonensis]|uniref:ATP-dependent endonuclease n=1 Tax=Arthrobacter dokdonellae TaxID=2211210 RepID=UPI001013D118|nr:ATP-dependent endonuclease [Arthrobacter dokdonellae]
MPPASRQGRPGRQANARDEGLAFADEGVATVPMGGATIIARHLELLGPAGLGLGVAGLCDTGDERYFMRGLVRAGPGPCANRTELRCHGFFVCVADLEDELTRALGADAVARIVDARGDLRSFRLFQNQPAQRERAVERQLRRFMGTHSGRKISYGRYLVDGLDLDYVPAPLDGLLSQL